MDSEMLNPQLTQMLKLHQASERAKFLARADLCDEYILQAKRVVELPDFIVNEVWLQTVQLLLKQGLTDHGLYILIAAIARSQGQNPNMGFLVTDSF